MEAIHAVDGNDRAAVRLALTRLDLNMVTALDALLTERSVTRAAERVGLTQPALSAALARLRAHFGDPLLVRNGRTHDLTPLGRRLAIQTGGVLDRLYSVFGVSSDFDPVHEIREFVIHSSDHSAVAVGTRVRRLAAASAPLVTFRFVHEAAAGIDPPTPAELLAGTDGAILPHGVLHGAPHVDLWDDEWMCLVSEDNDSVGDELTVENLATLPWVTNYHGPDRSLPPARHMHLLGIRPHVQTVVEGFLPIPAFVSGTRSVAFVPAALAHRIPPDLRVRALAPPFPIVPLQSAFWWHPVHDDDPAHRWLRSLFETAAQIERDTQAGEES